MVNNETDIDNYLPKIIDIINDNYPNGIIEKSFTFGQLTLTIEIAELKNIISFLKDDPRCNFHCFVDLCGVDFPDRPLRFEVVYHLLSLINNTRIRLKVNVADNSPVPSIMDIFPAANWFEREAFDLYGVTFSDHPDLRRMLTDYNFEGHPLRKDFPLSGFTEVRYDDQEKRVVRQPVQLSQEFRDFDFESPWEGLDDVAVDNNLLNNKQTKEE